MQESGTQVIIIYNRSYIDAYPFLWPRSFCPNPWADTMDVPYLLKYLTQHLAKRPNNCLFVAQAVLTPQTKTILTKPFSNLFKATKSIREALPAWIDEEASKLKPNIIMTDFVSATEIAPIIIALNHSKRQKWVWAYGLEK